jgi:hypothetical protein
MDQSIAPSSLPSDDFMAHLTRRDGSSMDNHKFIAIRASAHSGNDQGSKKLQPPQISTFLKHEEIISHLFKNMLSAIFNDLCKTAVPVAEDALCVIKMGLFHADAIDSLISSFESNSRSIRLPFNLRKSSKSHGRMPGT